MILTRLQWQTVLVPQAFITLLEVMRSATARLFFSAWSGILLVLAVALVGILSFAGAIFGIFKRMSQRELLATQEAECPIEPLRLRHLPPPAPPAGYQAAPGTGSGRVSGRGTDVWLPYIGAALVVALTSGFGLGGGLYAVLVAGLPVAAWRPALA